MINFVIKILILYNECKGVCLLINNVDYLYNFNYIRYLGIGYIRVV